MRTFLAAVLVAACAFPVLGEPTPGFELTYEAVTVQGPWEARGLLNVLQYETKNTLEKPSGMTLTAAYARVHSLQDATINANGAYIQNEAKTDVADYYDAKLEGANVSPDYYFAVLARRGLEPPTIAVQGTCATATLTESRSWKPASLVTPRPNLDFSTTIANAFELHECSAFQAIRVQGNFVLTHWEWNIAVAGKDSDGRAKSAELRSGYQAADQTREGTAGNSMQAYVEVTNGILEFRAGQASEPLLAVGQPELTGRDLLVQGNILRGIAHGTTASAPSKDFTAEGTNTLALTWTPGEAFGLHVAGDATPAVIHPSSQAGLVEQRFQWVGLTLAAVLALFAAVASWKPLRPWTPPEDILDHAKRFYSRGRYYRASWMARYAAWRGALLGPAYNQLAYAQAALRHTDSALRWFAKASRHYKDPDDVARNDYSAATAAAGGDDGEQAADWLFRAASLDPSYLKRAREDGEFDAVKDHPAFQAVLQGRFLGGSGVVTV